MKSAFLRRAHAARRVVLLGTVALLPILFVRANNDPVNVPKLSLLLAAVAIALALRIAEWLQGNEPRGWKRLAVPAAAFAVPLFYGWLLSPYKGWALFGFYPRFQGLIPYLAVIALGILIADEFTDDRRPLVIALVGSGMLVAAYAVIQVLGLDPIDWAQAGERKRWAGSTLGNPNFTGGFLGIVLPLSVGLLIDGWKRGLVAAACALIAAGWIVSFSQGGWAAGAAGVTIVGGWALAARFTWTRIAAVAVAGLIASAALGDVLLGIAKPGHPLVPATVQLRSYAYQAAVDMTMENPLTGRGPNTYAIEGAHYRSAEDGKRIDYNFPDDPHNVGLALATGGGILGAIGFLIAVIWAVRRGFSLAAGDVLGAAFFGAVVAYFVQSLVSVDELTLRVALWTALGGLAASGPSVEVQEEEAVVSRRERKRREREPLRNPIGVIVCGVLALAIVWWSLSFAMADARVWQGTLLAAEGRIDEAQNEFESAIGFKDDYQFRRLYALRMAEAALRQGEEGSELFDSALEQFSFLEDFPLVAWMSEYARVLYAAAVFDPSYYERALEVYDRMQEIDPYNPVIRAEAARVLIALDRPQEAFDRLEPFIGAGIGNKNPEVWGTIALASALTGDLEQAERAALRAFDRDPEQPEALQAMEIVEQGS